MATQLNTDSLTDLSRKGTCIEFFSAYQDLEFERMIALCNPQGEVYFQPLGESGRGTIDGLGCHLWLALLDSFPDLDNTVDSAITQDDSIECRVSIFGTRRTLPAFQAKVIVLKAIIYLFSVSMRRIKS